MTRRPPRSTLLPYTTLFRSRELVSEILKITRRMYDYVVVDTPPFFSDQVLAALDLSQWYILLATPDIPALKNLRLTLDMFDMLEYPASQRIVVLNRCDAQVGLTPADLDRVLAARDLSKWYILLATPDIPAVKNLRLTVDMFAVLEYRASRRIVVLNRCDAQVGLTPAEIERVVRARIAGRVPSTRDVPVS